MVRFWASAGPAIASPAATTMATVLTRSSSSVQFGDTTTPQGCSPTGIDLVTVLLATSMTDTSLEMPLVVKSSASSGVKASCQTRWPTSR